MGKFTVVPSDTFDTLQLDAGVLLKNFDPSNPVAPADADIICATTGGVNPSCVPTFSDFGEDIDNVPNNMKELKHLDGWDCGISTTGLGTSPALIRMALGCADIDTTDTTKIVPRADLSQEDFTDIWWVGDKANGGMVAIQLKNALSTGGFSLQTSKNGKGQIALTITGHVSISAQKEVPMVFYSADPASTTYSVTQTLSHVTSSSAATSATAGSAFSATLTAEEGYGLTGDGASVSVTMGGTDITSTAYNSSTGAVAIASVTGNIVIAATAVSTQA